MEIIREGLGKWVEFKVISVEIIREHFSII